MTLISTLCLSVSGSEAFAEAGGEFDDAAELGLLVRCGVAEGEFRFQKKSGEGVVEFPVQARCDRCVGVGAVLGAAGESGADLANDACRVGEDKVDFEYRCAAGRFVEQVCGFGIGGCECLFDEDEAVLVTAKPGHAVASVDDVLDGEIEVLGEGGGDGLTRGFGSDEQDGGETAAFGHVAFSKARKAGNRR